MSNGAGEAYYYDSSDGGGSRAGGPLVLTITVAFYSRSSVHGESRAGDQPVLTIATAFFFTLAIDHLEGRSERRWLPSSSSTSLPQIKLCHKVKEGLAAPIWRKVSPPCGFACLKQESSTLEWRNWYAVVDLCASSHGYGSQTAAPALALRAEARSSCCWSLLATSVPPGGGSLPTTSAFSQLPRPSTPISSFPFGSNFMCNYAKKHDGEKAGFDFGHLNKLYAGYCLYYNRRLFWTTKRGAATTAKTVS
ncbi:hypothetical protein ZWY2020_039812 [Hordeum vulgare]|nr:hypothetical protein ZWY2020_039812 [Hordeum vulgare]